MDKKLVKNYFYNILYQMVKVVLPLFVVPYTYAHIGAETLGISDLACNIAGWFILFGTLGVNTYGNREIAKVRDNKDDLNRSFFEIFYMQVINMILATIGYYLFVICFKKDNFEIYLLTGILLISSMMDISWLYFGVEDFKKSSIRNIAVKLIGVFCIFMFVKTPEQLWLFVVINCCSELFGQIIMFVQLKQYITFRPVSIKDAYKHHLKASFALFVPTIAISVYTMLDQTMIGELHSPLHLNLYKTSMSFIKMFLYFITSIGTVMLPRVTNVFYKDENGESRAKEYINTTMKIALMLALPMTLGIVAVSPYFVPWYIPSAPDVAKLIMIGSPIIIFISISNVTGTQFMVPVGMYNLYSKSVIYGAVLNGCVNLILIPKLGAYGAIIGSIIAEFSVTAYQLYTIRNRVRISFLNSCYFKYLICSVMMYAAASFIGRIMGPRLLTNLCQAGCGVIVYFVLLIVLKDETVMKVIDKFLSRIRGGSHE